MRPSATSTVRRRAAAHAALGDPRRLTIADALRDGDHTPAELADAIGLSSSHVAFHLGVLERAGLVQRRRSDGDARRRYVTLTAAGWRHAAASFADGPPTRRTDDVLFVCTRNAARSQLARVLWRHHTGTVARSAGLAPAATVDRRAVRVAARHGLDLSHARPVGLTAIEDPPALVIAVCDRAYEAGIPVAADILHWSIPDPSSGSMAAVERAFGDLDARISRLVRGMRDTDVRSR
ncbi:MAG: helix-turn-helix domain-containing protein [Nitriliruptoraceae bacterium]